ncbi:TMEM175 family protein [Amnibacterium sp. CER49]|uniref:TMEM175 family protein n=1 Tax=Amnibacterium sp. CER49 TaxID=3039161 RepID=UPI002447C927|nr:TMEM175 family protein [Amnibacterium sp. CER49]MDH2442645.1 TMEM175 family protein [Amnibacterium sp. CER49]
MRTGRLEAFSDGVIAIAITLMVLELPKPHGATWLALRDDLPVLLAYLLSFVYLGIYWNNHHHMLAVSRRVNGTVLWANLHLLFWLSLVPFVTGWLSEQKNPEPVPVAVYGIVLLLAAVAFFLLRAALLRVHGGASRLSEAVGRDRKGTLSPVLYLVGILLSFVQPWLGLGVYALVALIWFVPDRRVERVVAQDHEEGLLREER